MKILSTMSVVVGVLSMLAGTASASYFENFQSGYTDSTALIGQNSWTAAVDSGYGAGLVTSSTAGNPGWGVAATSGGGQEGASINSAVSSTSTDTLYVSVDAYIGGGTSYPGLAISSADNSKIVFLQIGADYTYGLHKDPLFGVHTIDGGSANSSIVSGEWYRLQIAYQYDNGASNDNLTFSVYRYSTASTVYSTTYHDGTLSSFTPLAYASLEGYIASGNTAGYDNLWVGTTPYVPSVPEPATLGLLAAGTLVMLGRKRKQAV